MDKIFPSWKWGVPKDVLLIHSKEIAKFLLDNKIQPFEEINVLESLGQTVAVKKAAAKPSPDPWIQQRLPDYSIWGGMKIPHLHYNGQVFMLDQKQWAAFSRVMLTKIREKLADTKEVSFDELMELSSVVGNL